MSAASLSEPAHAKINLALHVTGRRADGYHTLESLVVFARAGDRITVTPASADDFTVSGAYAAETPRDASNLVLRARDLFRAHGGCEPLAIHLEKHLPVASGLGGGSADAAATLRAMARAAGGRSLPAETALSLGADVPMCLRSRAALARGIGEELRELDGLPPFGLVLVNPGVAVSTPAVFAKLERRDNQGLGVMPDRPTLARLVDWLKTTRNDLEAPALALAPVIGNARDAMARAGAAFVRMSGSGATCFGIFRDEQAAEQAAAGIRAAEPHWFVCSTETLP